MGLNPEEVQVETELPSDEQAVEPGGPVSPAVAELSELLRERDAQILELQEQVRRVAADFENFRRRQEEEQKRRLQHLKEELFRQLLTILDSLEQALQASTLSASVEALLQGVEMVVKDYRKLLSQHGVEPIATDGAVFDPKLHEAMMLEERDDVPDQAIVCELQRGYRMGDRVLRPSLVKVASNPAQNPTTP